MNVDPGPATERQWNCLAGAGLVLLAVASTCFFYGFGINLVSLVVAVAALLGAVTLTIPEQRRFLARNPVGAGYALAALAYLAFTHALSVSADSSFAATWVMALMPLGYLAGGALGASRSRTLLLCGAAVWLGGLFLFSAVRFLLSGQRAHDPLVDPNNYATLIYLVWIPVAHGYLHRSWRGEVTRRSLDTGVQAASALALLALFATGSRTGAAVAATALVIWLLWGVAKRKPLGRWSGLVAGGVVAYVVVTIYSPDFTAKAVSAASYAGGVTTRAALVTSALSMFLDHPLTGTGAYGFQLLYPSYRLLADQETVGKFVHSDYVQLLAEGGPLLLLLIGGVAVALARRLWRGLVRDDADPLALGATVALCAAFAHAMVNFVFFTPVLALMIGLLLSLVFSEDTVIRRATPRRLSAGITGGALVFGWAAWLFLCLDLAVYGVFQGQPGVPFAKSIGQDAERALAFARSVQQLNGNRGAPVLAEAMLLEKMAQAGDESAADEAREAFARALALGRWNPSTYVQLERHLARTQPGELLDEREALLRKALALEPVYVQAIDGLVDLYDRSGRAPQTYVLLRTRVYPWIELLGRLDSDAALAYLDRMERDTRIIGDAEFLAAIDASRGDVLAISEDRVQRPFFMKMFTASRD